MALLLVTAVAIRAARAFSEPYSVTQPDGTTLTLTLHGDEHGHWTMTSDGVLVVGREQGYYVAAIDDAGMLTATGLLAHSLQQRTSRPSANSNGSGRNVSLSASVKSATPVCVGPW